MSIFKKKAPQTVEVSPEENILKDEPRVKDFSDFQSPHEASVERLVQAIDKAYHRPGLMLWRSFWQGFMSAIGLSVGYAVVVIILIYVFRSLGGIELLQPFANKIQEMVIPKELRSALENQSTTSSSTSSSSTTETSSLTQEQLQSLLQTLSASKSSSN